MVPAPRPIVGSINMVGEVVVVVERRNDFREAGSNVLGKSILWMLQQTE